jgi:antitoxin component YwqK of YwqJK toxin-antitoxin module
MTSLPGRKTPSIFIRAKYGYMEFDYIDMEGNNEYRFEYKHDDELKVYFKEHPLFSYEVENGQLKGSGYCFYPFEKRVAIQAEFRKSKLHGLVVVQDRNGKLLEIMKYKKGKYVRHLFLFNIKGKKGLRKYSRDHTGNPLLGDEVIEI